MRDWSWWDTLLVLAAMIVTALTITAARGAEIPPVRYDYIPLDTVGCGHLERCVPRERVRWMSHNPFAATRRTETR
jgi:hypothetical protein